MPETPLNVTQKAGSPPHLALRSALGQFATGVCVVTARAVNQQTTPFGITVNSFTSVSLEPPMVLWCLQNDSITHDLWQASPRFAINVLGQQQAALCERYAIRGNHGMPHHDDYRLSALGNPLIEGAAAFFECAVNTIHDAGDHCLIVADVLAFDSDANVQPLIYLRGQIRG